MIYLKCAKRFADLVFGLCALILFALPILLAILAVKLNSPGPVFFLQTRIGQNGKTFRIYKLRTMTVDPNRCATVEVAKNDPGVFFVGRFLRRFKIDEMPQIINVVRGDMSFVGPRPCLDATLKQMPEWAWRRFEVRPGITGLAQTRGNIALTWEKRWEQDIKYIDNLSFTLDIWLILKTILIVILGEEKFRETA
jgi:undecaprenyl phosphate N,N'-diacetylbacillosamine 1-phosphate transferase